MNDESRSYGSYLGRVFSLIVAVVLLVLAVWFVVQLATSDDETANTDTSEVAQQDSPAASDVENEDATIIDEALAGSQDTTDGGTVAADDSQGQTLSTNTDELPNTGLDTSGFLLLALGTFVTAHGVQVLATQRSKN